LIGLRSAEGQDEPIGTFAEVADIKAHELRASKSAGKPYEQEGPISPARWIIAAGRHEFAQIVGDHGPHLMGSDSKRAPDTSVDESDPLIGGRTHETGCLMCGCDADETASNRRRPFGRRAVSQIKGDRAGIGREASLISLRTPGLEVAPVAAIGTHGIRCPAGLEVALGPPRDVVEFESPGLLLERKRGVMTIDRKTLSLLNAQAGFGLLSPRDLADHRSR
jgi:hypothetical protein